VWTRLIWLNTEILAGTCGRVNEPSGSKKTGGISWLAEDPLASEEEISYMMLVIKPVITFKFVRVIKSRRMRWAGHVGRMGEEMGCIGSW